MRPPRRLVPALALLLALVAVSQAVAQPPPDSIRGRYTKSEYLVPMRDGVRLFTAVYVPKDTAQTYPILMTRTPYSCRPYGVDRYPGSLGPNSQFSQSGYIFVYQDVRGRWLSEGEFVNMRPYLPNKKGPTEIDETSDTYDTIDWLLKNVKGNNGRAGQWGISYPGFYTDCGMIDAHPALKAASPQAPVTDWFVGDDFHHNGALFLPHLFNFIAGFGRPRPMPTTQGPPPFRHGTPDGYDFFLRLGPLPNADAVYFKGDVPFWNEVMRHPNYDDFWKARNLRQHIKNIKPAVLTVGGWFDAENLFGALETFKNAEASGPAGPNYLVMGPWFHGGWSRSTGEALGPVQFGSATAELYRKQIEFPFFEHHLKDKPAPDLPKATAFETGSNRWRKFDAWPPKGATPRPFYFQAGGQLAQGPPKDEGEAFDEYVSDPAKPVPYQEKTAIGMTREYMTADQRFAGRRPDVLVYQTGPLSAPLTVAGQIEVELQVSTTGTDSDWVVKVIDVYPDDAPDPPSNTENVRMGGYQQLVRGDVMRGRFRNSYEKPEPFEPGKPTAVKLRLNDICHTFQPRHRLMVQVQSSWFPLVDRNPQTFVDIYTAKPEDFRKATQRVYRSAGLPSRLTLPVLPADETGGPAR
jgi:putative CocE/NonD family hydrolase